MSESRETYPSGIKWTKQRKNVYQVLAKAQEPLSAVQIYHRLEKEEIGETFAVSTVYRILSAFEKNGLVSRTNWMGEGTIVYELNRGGHTHYAVCLDCHKRVPLAGCPVVHAELDRETGDFQVTGHKLELYGYCKECQRTHKEKKQG